MPKTVPRAVIIPIRPEPETRRSVPKNLFEIETQIRKILENADSNGDGRYTRDELKKALKDLGSWIPGWRAKRFLVKADANNDGQICGEEIDTLVDHLIANGFGK